MLLHKTVEVSLEVNDFLREVYYESDCTGWVWFFSCVEVYGD